MSSKKKAAESQLVAITKKKIKTVEVRLPPCFWRTAAPCLLQRDVK